MHDQHQHAHGAGFAVPKQLSHLGSVCLAALGASGVAVAGLTEPHKNDAPGLQAEGIEGQRNADKQDSEASNQGEQASIVAGKRFATLRAHLALHGVSLYPLADGSFVASNWNLTKPLADLHAVATFAQQIAGGTL